MTLDTFITIVAGVLAALCGLGHLYCSRNARLRYTDQRIPEEGC